LVIRSICCLVPEENSNITVKRIVDRYLEHSRILIFGTGDNAEVIMGSADLMTRNLYHRIEVYVPVKNQDCKQELIKYFDIQWNDNDKAVLLLPGFNQKKLTNDNITKINAQQSIYNFIETKS
ncbi:MAG: polyphosphate kinase 1, partial [Ginsengibacter sp.]